MPLLPRKFSFEHTVHWSVRNFHLCPPWDDIVIISPEFDVRLLDMVSLRLFLESQGPGNGMVLGVCSDGDAFDDLDASMDFDVCIVIQDEEEILHSTNGVPFEPKKPPTTPFICCAVMEDVNPDMQLDDEELVLHLTIRTSVKQGPYWSRMFDMHLVALSNDLVSMVPDPMSNKGDCHMASKNYEESAMVHYCILKARVPHLFDGESRHWDEEKKRWETGLSKEANRTAKFYLYGRLALPIPLDQKKELVKFARLNKLKDFESMLKPNTIEFNLGTNLVLEDIGFNLLIADIAWVNSGPRRIPFSLDNISTQNLVVTLTITANQCVDFNFKFLDFETVVPIYMKGSIKLIDNSDQIAVEHEICHIFTTKAWTIPPPHFLSKDLADRLRLKMIVCKVQLTEGLFEPKKVKVDFTENDDDDLLVINNLRVLGDQLLALYTNQVNCDLELHSGGEVLKVHKAIMVARSPKIKEMVLEQETDAHESDEPLVLQLENFQPRALKKAILYMYSGRMDLDSHEVDIAHLNDVIDVASHLQIDLLRDEYS